MSDPAHAKAAAAADATPNDDKSLTLAQVAEHTSKKDLYLVVHEKVYNVTKFIDEHPGGEEVLMDEGGKDATEAFEDIGHSDEARDILKGLYVGELKRAEGEAKPVSKPVPKTSTGGTTTQSVSSGNLNYLIPLAVLIAYVSYKYYIGLQEKK